MRRSLVGDCLRFLTAATLLAWSGLLFATSPTVTLSVSPTSIELGYTATLTWSSTNATSCTLSGAYSGPVHTSGSMTVWPSAAGKNSYSLDCSGSGGSASKSVTLNVTSPPIPTVTLSVSPTSIDLTETATLTWSSTNATSCTFSGGYTGEVLPSGSHTVKPTATGKDSYTLGCSGRGGSASKSVTLKVNTPPAPIVTVAVNPSSIVLGNSATLTWSSTYATSCVFSGIFSASVGLQSSSTSPTTVSPPAIGSYTATLTCSGDGGTTAQSATLEVTSPPPPVVSLSISPATVPLGTAATLTWTSSNATSCSFSGALNRRVKTESSTKRPQTVKPFRTGTYSYELACTGSGGTSTQSVNLQVTSAGQPAISLVIVPSNVPLGSSATLTWTALNSSSCSFSGAYSGSVATQSTTSSPLTVKPKSANYYTYMLTCSGSGGTASQSATLGVLTQLGQQIYAAQQTAANTSPSSSCGAIDQNQTGSNDGFYWEIGDLNGIITDSKMDLSASGSVQPAGTSGQNYTRSGSLLIDSGTKWMYASYVAEIKAQRSGGSWTMPSRYVPFLHFTSGYVNMADDCNYIDTPTVQNCLDASNDGDPAMPNGTKTSADSGIFDYGSGHMEVLEAGADPTLTGYMDGGDNTISGLTSEVTTAFEAKNVNANFSFATPITAGGIATTPGDYATFLQGMLNTSTPLVMRSFLNPTASDPYAVCTNPYDSTCVNSKGDPLALYAPLPGNVSWHYGLGHWIEDDPDTGDGSYSSPGKAGFYPWIDSTKTYYGMVSRYDTSGNASGTNSNASTAPFYLSIVCGEAIRKAFMTGTVQP